MAVKINFHDSHHETKHTQ